MSRTLAVIAGTFLVALASAQENNLSRILCFETEHIGGFPGGWTSPRGGVGVDGDLFHTGKWSARIERQADSAGPFTGILKTIPMDFAGTTLQLRAFLRTQDVTGLVGLWMREDGDSTMLAFENMSRRKLKGTNDWQEYSIVLPVVAAARTLSFGVFVAGTGTAWADDLQLLVDGKPIWEAPRAARQEAVTDRDHEFDGGSKIALENLTDLQQGHLTTLGKVWGYLKYHHPLVTAGKRHWDYELFRVLPTLLGAGSREAANAAIVKWIAALGTPRACDPCAKLDLTDLHLRPTLAWTADQTRLGADLCASLLSIHANRPVTREQFYVAFTAVGNPTFQHEPDYGHLKAADAGFQLLALYRFWNIIEYWFPYRDVLGEDWDAVLRQSIPKIALATTQPAYQRELLAMIARVHDTHANLWSSLAARPPGGAFEVPAHVRFLEDLAVVTGGSGAESRKAGGLEPGDVIRAIDGVPLESLVHSWLPYYAASNRPTQLRDLAQVLTRGVAGEASIRVRRNGEDLEVKATRVAPAARTAAAGTHDLPGDTFRRLGDDVAYLKLSSIRSAEVSGYIAAAAGTKGLILDLRNYPSEFVVFALGSHLVERETEFVRFTKADPANPGAFHWKPALALHPQAPHYEGQVIILVDEITQSSAEYTAMAMRAAPGAKVVGSTTAGADGNVSEIPLPGGLRAMISGIGVFYPDQRPTQRVGIVPDVEVKPTIAGIRAGRDEVLEEALRQILGPQTSAAEIEQILKI